MNRMVRALVLLAVLAAPALAAASDLAVRAGVLHTGTGEILENAIVVIEDGRIADLGPADTTPVPSGMRVLEAPVVTPGLVDGRSVVGLAGALNEESDQEQLERSAAIQPALRAVDAYNPRERLVGWLREHGITTVHTGHAPGEAISGQTLIAKTTGETVAEAVMVPRAGLVLTLGDAATVDGSPRTPRESPGTTAKVVAMLREQFVAAETYTAKRAGDKPPDRDLGLETLADVLAGELPLIVEANAHTDIMTALRLREEFGFELILSGVADAPLVMEEIVAADVPVLVHPIMVRGRRHSAMENVSFTTPAALLEAGVTTGLQSGYESYVPKTRVVLFEAALGLGYGLSPAQALHLVTMGPATILGIDDRVGSIEVGKDGDLALFDGDPFEYTTHVIGTVIEGVQVSDTVR